MRGKFITFEGIDGVGKTTQALLLFYRLRKHGIECVATREPGGSPLAEAMRGFVLSGKARVVGGDMVELMMLAVARQDHIKQLIYPALESGNWVVCDRFIDSTRVYQGTQDADRPALDMGLILYLEKLTVGDLYPDLTVLLDSPVDLGLKRIKERKASVAYDRFEDVEWSTHEIRRSAFLHLARQEPQRFVVVKVDSMSEQEVAECVWSAVMARNNNLTPGPPTKHHLTKPNSSKA